LSERDEKNAAENRFNKKYKYVCKLKIQDRWFKSCQGSKLQSMMFCIGMPIYEAQLNSPREEAYM
jgi:hypothetical protein